MATENHPSSQPLSSSSHRLPTVSASQALKRLRTVPPRIISTGLTCVDSIIAGHPIGATTTNPINSIIGLSCAHITDVYGPSGVGKTAFCLQTAVLTLQKGHDVIWIDCGTPIPISRLKELLRMHAGPSDDALHKLKLADMASRFHHYSVADLAHLLALFVHPGADFPSDKTALIIIDSISTTFEGAYARIIDDRSKRPSEAAKWAARRKYAVMADLISRLEKVATMNNLAVLLTQQTRLNLKFGIGGLLTPSMFEPEWGNGIWTQLVMFRDFPPNNGTQHSEETTVRLKRLRYLGLIKINGVSAEENGRFGTMVPISIEKDGLSELPPLSANIAVPILSSPSRPTKRPFDEVANSEEEDLLSDDGYGLEDDLDFESGLTKPDVAV